MGETDHKQLCCLRVKGDGTDQVLDTATITHCHLCGHDVWIAPSGVAMVARDISVRVVCMHCVLKQAEANPDEPVNVDAPPGAWEELAQQNGVTPRDVAQARMVLQLMQADADRKKEAKIRRGARRR